MTLTHARTWSQKMIAFDVLEMAGSEWIESLREADETRLAGVLALHQNGLTASEQDANDIALIIVRTLLMGNV